PRSQVQGATGQPRRPQGRVPGTGRGTLLAGAACPGVAPAGCGRTVMFGFLRRKPKLAAGRRPAMDHGERILAWADAPQEQVVVATNQGLWLPGRARLGWHDINKAAWSGRELRITAAAKAQVRDGWTVVVDEPVQSFLLLEPG